MTQNPAAKKSNTQRSVIAVVDSNSLMHRAFHAIPAGSMHAPDGRPTNALYGFFSMLVRLVENFQPDGLICAFDLGRPQVRMDVLPSYKAQRPPMDPMLRSQFPLAKELLGVLNIPVVQLEGWEGDDILGTLAVTGEKAGYDMLLFTGDRDMYQLSNEHIRIAATKKGMSDVAIMTPQSVEALYHGVIPELIPDFYGLKGDTSDNIPGVPGIGPKKAAALIVQYGTLENVIAHAADIPGKMGENLRAHLGDARISKEVATIRTDAPLDFDFAQAAFPSFDPSSAFDAFVNLGFNSLTHRLLALSPKTNSESSQFIELLQNPQTGEEAQKFLAAALRQKDLQENLREDLQENLEQDGFLGVAWERIPAEQQAGQMILGAEDVQRLWVASSDGIAFFEGMAADATLLTLLKHGRIAAADIKALLHVMSPADSSACARFDVMQADPTRLFDVSVAGYLLASENKAPTAAELAKHYLAEALPAPTEAGVSAQAIEALAARLLVEPLRVALEQDGSLEVFTTIEMPLVPVLAQIEREGLAVDPSILHEQARELAEEIERIVASITELAGESINLDSPMQLSHLLFEVLKLPTTGLKKTKRGYYSTNAKALNELAKKEAVVRQVLHYRELSKIKTTYLDALPELIASDGRIHTTLHQTATTTGRLSSSEPNLQNIPTRSELGHRVRTAFKVNDNKVFLACDYSQIELRLLAHLSEDEGLIDAFCKGEDFHAETAARVFGVSVEEITPQLRSRAKAVNFGIVYGQQAFGLSQSLNISFQEAQDMITRYFEAYPKVRAYLDNTVASAKSQGYASTMYGRKRRIPELQQKNRQLYSFGERTAMNHPMQGSAADIIKLAMIEVQKRLHDQELTSHLVLQIHDELDLEVPTSELEHVVHLVKDAMESVVELRVPLIAEASWAKDWAGAK